jgi:hypothetical protein
MAVDLGAVAQIGIALTADDQLSAPMQKARRQSLLARRGDPNHQYGRSPGSAGRAGTPGAMRSTSSRHARCDSARRAASRVSAVVL